MLVWLARVSYLRLNGTNFWSVRGCALYLYPVSHLPQVVSCAQHRLPEYSGGPRQVIALNCPLPESGYVDDMRILHIFRYVSSFCSARKPCMVPAIVSA